MSNVVPRERFDTTLSDVHSIVGQGPRRRLSDPSLLAGDRAPAE